MGDRATVEAMLGQVQLRRSRTYSGQSGPKACSDSTSNPSLAYHSMLAHALATCKIGAMPSIASP